MSTFVGIKDLSGPDCLRDTPTPLFGSRGAFTTFFVSTNSARRGGAQWVVPVAPRQLRSPLASTNWSNMPAPEARLRSTTCLDGTGCQRIAGDTQWWRL